MISPISAIQRRLEAAAARGPPASGPPAATACRQMRTREIEPVFPHHRPQGRRRAGGFHREHRAPGDLQRQRLHRSQQIDRAVHPGAQRRHRSSATASTWRASSGSMRGARAGAMVRRCRRQASPSRQQQPLAGQRAQDADRGRGAAVVAGIVHQHAVDRVRRVQQQGGAAEEVRGVQVLLGTPPAATGPAHWSALRAGSRAARRRRGGSGARADGGAARQSRPEASRPCRRMPEPAGLAGALPMGIVPPAPFIRERRT